MKEKEIFGHMAILIVAGIVGITILSSAAIATMPVVKEIKYLTDSPNFEGNPLWTSNGEKIIYANWSGAWGDRTSWIMNADGSNKERLYAGEGNFLGASDISPDGKTLLITKNLGYWYDLYKVDIDGTNLTPLANDPSLIEVDGFWSPNGDKIAYLSSPSSGSYNDMWTMNADGSNKALLVHVSTHITYGHDWSPDETKIIFSVKQSCTSDSFWSCNYDLFEINSDGTGLRQITNTPYIEWHPQYSPDGKYIAYASIEDGNRNLWLAKSDWSERVQLATDDGLGDVNIKWSPDGSKIVFVGHNWDNEHGDIAVVTLDYAPTTVGKLTQLTSGAAQELAPSWSPDGTKIAYSTLVNNEYRVWVMNADGSNQAEIPNALYATAFVNAWNPDGTKVTFQKTDVASSSNKDVYTINIDGTGLTKLTTDGMHEGSPAWSPDGTKIVYVVDRDWSGGYDAWIMNADGSNKQQLTNDIYHPDYFAWSPDGTKLAYHTSVEGQIWVMNPDGSGRMQLTFNEGYKAWPSWSPDGAKIAYMSTLSGNIDIWMMNADGSGAIQLTSDSATDAYPAWSPDGKKIAFASDRSGSMAIWIMELQTGSTPPLTAAASADITEGLVPLKVSFAGSASGGTPNYTYLWNFGDGKTSTEQNPKYKYKETGVYSATLTVTDSLGNSVTSAPIQIKAFTQWAVVIGVDEYPNKISFYDPPIELSFVNLNSALDAQRIRDTLVNLYRFPVGNVHLLQDKTGNSTDTVEWNNVKSEMDWLASKATENDIVVFYYSGHGVGVNNRILDENQYPEYLVFHGTKVSDTDFTNEISSIKSKKLSVILDASWSGGFIYDNDVLSDLAANNIKGRIVTTGCTEYKSDDDADCKELQHPSWMTAYTGEKTGGIFTGLFDFGLRGGKNWLFPSSDSDSNGKTSVEEAFYFARAGIPTIDWLTPSEDFLQEPEMYDGIDGEFYLGDASPPTKLKIKSHSPANPLVIDESGFKVGFDPSVGSTVIETFGANYTGHEAEPQVLEIPGLLPGNYTVQLFGTAAEPYKVEMELLSTSGEVLSSQTYEGTILPGEILTGSLNSTGTEMQSVTPVRMPASIANDKFALAEYIKLELEWENSNVENMNIPQDVKTGLTDKLTSSIGKLNAITSDTQAGNDANAKQAIIPTKNMLGAFQKQVKAQQGKGISTSDANALLTVSNNILKDLEKLNNLLAS